MAQDRAYRTSGLRRSKLALTKPGGFGAKARDEAF
jgi:hypothetical protein